MKKKTLNLTKRRIPKGPPKGFPKNADKKVNRWEITRPMKPGNGGGTVRKITFRGYTVVISGNTELGYLVTVTNVLGDREFDDRKPTEAEATISAIEAITNLLRG